jgi:hypothetical protein
MRCRAPYVSAMNINKSAGIARLRRGRHRGVPEASNRPVVSRIKLTSTCRRFQKPLRRDWQRELSAIGANGPARHASHVTIAPTSTLYARMVEYIRRHPSSVGVRTSEDIHPPRSIAGTRNSDTHNPGTRIPDTNTQGTRIRGTRIPGTPLVRRTERRSVGQQTPARSGRGC